MAAIGVELGIAGFEQEVIADFLDTEFDGGSTSECSASVHIVLLSGVLAEDGIAADLLGHGKSLRNETVEGFAP